MKKYNISNYLASLNEVEFIGQKETSIENIISINNIYDNPAETKKALTWVGDSYLSAVTENIEIACIILTKKGYERLKYLKSNFIITDNPRRVFQKILSIFYALEYSSKVEKSAFVYQSSKIGKNAYIGHNVVIEEECEIGDNVTILHNTVIYRDTKIGNNVVIGSNCTIGNYGFGYEKDEDGQYKRLEHLGNVVIGNNVEIHNNTCIDRAVLGSTILRDNVKVDNQVHIAHSVDIHENALVIANAVVAGSTVVGKNSWIGPTVTLKDKLTIAENTLVGIGTVVTKNTEPNTIMVGNPALKIEDFKKILRHQKSIIQNEDQ
ncbi:UDP-3-O-(3-hydroxymyristoyl)glucosamine N-acyltransferase [Hyphobacterium sp. CCMP332]|nr:UDP-3-O-(3-hydroxymyristoyl)glucosamine N-acyltransferase [Hyphobacterium sp. CCMP332]